MKKYEPDSVLRFDGKEEAAREAVDVLDAGDERDVGIGIAGPWIEVPVRVDDEPPDESEAQPG